MQSFTYMSEEAVAAVCAANDERADKASHFDRQYEVRLNPSDFRNLMAAMLYVWQRCQDSDPYPDIREANELPEWCGDFVSSIATTLEIEMV